MSPRQVAIITGAGSGIGQASAVLLAKAGFNLALVGRNSAKLRATAEKIRQQSQDADSLILPADVGRPEAARLIIEETLKKWGRIDAVVNNAAVGYMRPIDQLDEQMLCETFAVNALGPIRLVAAVWPAFIKQAGGCVINISSMATVDPFPGLSVYAASKAAIESLSRSIINEGRRHGIRAFSLAPGAVETAMLRGIFSEQELPAERTLDPVAIAEVVVECVIGRRDGQLGQTILLPSP